MKKTVLLSLIVVLSLLLIGNCNKNSDVFEPKSEMFTTPPSHGRVNPYDTVFVQYANEMFGAMFEESIRDSTMRYEEWMVKVDSIFSSLPSPSFSNVADEFERLNDSCYKQLFASFFMNLEALGIYRSAEYVENQVFSLASNEQEKNLCFFVLSFMKVTLQCLDDLQQIYMPGNHWYYRYLDCMRERYENMNWIDWVAFIKGCPMSFYYEVASCIWDATHEAH